MADPKSDPLRRCVPLAEWPPQDREAWAVATRQGDLFDGEGPAARWRPETQRAVIAAYGRYLGFLDRNGWLDRDAGPEARITPDRLRAYIAELTGMVAPVTLSGRITNLAGALRVMRPDVHYPYLNRAQRRLKARARPTRNKRARLVSSQQLAALGLTLIARAEREAFPREVWRACVYRDGVIILLLATRPIRRCNLAEMRLDRHLVRSGDGYRLAFDSDSTKNHRPYERPLDPALTPFIDRYLEHYRPILLGSSASDHVWISWRGIAMSDCCLYGRIVQHTATAFGRALSPHLFRDAAITSLGEENPEHVWLGLSLLHHADPRIAEKSYNQARASHAVRNYQSVLRGRRRKMMPIRTRMPQS